MDAKKPLSVTVPRYPGSRGKAYSAIAGGRVKARPDHVWVLFSVVPGCSWLNGHCLEVHRTEVRLTRQPGTYLSALPQDDPIYGN